MHRLRGRTLVWIRIGHNAMIVLLHYCLSYTQDEWRREYLPQQYESVLQSIRFEEDFAYAACEGRERKRLDCSLA